MTARGKYAPLSVRFLRSALAFPERPAVEVAGVTLTYNELHRRALGIARLLLERDPGSGGPQLSAVFASRSVEAFAAVLGILLRGHGYVPLNPRSPLLRNRDMLQRAGCRVVVVDPQHLDAARELAAELPDPPVLLVPPGEEPDEEVALPPGSP